MREITRIHIAKVAYDIELDAKEDIEKYITALERYANDSEILGDIEIRITELLAERGVAAGGVITKDDVAAVRAQLGEPSDFAAEGIEDEAMDGSNGDDVKRVYRDTDNAVVGGVLSGFARYFGIDPLWVRLLFIVVLLASAGTGLVVYFILWLIIPPAETVAEKLRMSGQPVTLASIKELVKSEERRGESSQVMRRILSTVGGTVLVLAAISGLLAIVGVVFGVRFGFWSGQFMPAVDQSMYQSWWFIAMTGLFIVSGLLFSALCFILASAVFRREWTRRVGTAVVAIIAAGLVVFASGVGTGMYGYVTERARIAALRETTSTELPASFMGIKSITFSDGGEASGSIRYTVSAKPYYTLDTLPGTKAEVKVSDDGLSATVKLVGKPSWIETPTLTIYGPALDTVRMDSDHPTVFYDNESGQKQLSISAKGSGSRLNVEGDYETVSVVSDAYSSVALESAAIGELTVDGGGVRAGVVRHLIVTQPDVCPAHDGYMGGYSINVQGISGGKITYNGKEQPAQTIDEGCGRVIIGDEM